MLFPVFRRPRRPEAFCLGLTTSATAEDLLQVGADFLAANFLSLPGNLQP